jgi:hypothetical protein
MSATNPYLHLSNEKELRSLLRMARASKETAREALINEAIAALTPYHSAFVPTVDMSKVGLAVAGILGVIAGSPDQKTVVIDETLAAQINAAGDILAKFRGPPPVRTRKAKTAVAA